VTLKIKVKEAATEYKTFDDLINGELFRKAFHPRTTVYIKLGHLEYFVLSDNSSAQGRMYEYSAGKRQMKNCVPINGTLEIES
jgi:hypothetical protein